MAIKYMFRDGEIRTFTGADTADAQKIGDALAAITDRSGGHLVPQAVVSAARDKRNPLHQHFEWRDTVAAEKFRLEQARSIIRCVHIVDKRTENGTIRAFLSVTEKAGVSYRTLDEVLSSADLQSKVLAAAERDLLAFEQRYRSLHDVCNLIKRVREEVQDRRKRLTDKSEARPVS